MRTESIRIANFSLFENPGSDFGVHYKSTQPKRESRFVFPVVCVVKALAIITMIHSHSIWACTWQNQQNDICAQQKLRSAWASTQSDHKVVAVHMKNIEPLTTYWAHGEDSDQTGRMHSDQTGQIPRANLSLRLGHIILLVLLCCDTKFYQF